MSRQICEVTARNKHEALAALEMLKERIESISDTQTVHETVVVTDEGRA